MEKIRDSKDKKCSDLKNIVFFVLSNNSIDKVREYSGDNQIGSISFTIKDNLITTNDIITKAQNDLNFQKKLYKVLKDEYENFNINIRKFKGALELSNSGLKNIEGLINGEYEIDRNEFLEKITKDNEEYVRIQLYKSLMLSVTRYCTGDWSKIKTNYSYVDKQFLNKQFTKYGKYHIKELLRTIYQMHMDELLPEILISIRNSFQNAKSEVNKFKKSIREQEAIVQLIILKSFITYSDKIKQDQELIEAYEDILEILINLNYEQAAVILDEFRIH